MYDFEISEKLQEIMRKLSKKDRSLYDRLVKKINEVVNSYDIEHYKNLRHDMKDSKRVKIGHFVLVFQFNREKKRVRFDDLDHHDKIYRK